MKAKSRKRENRRTKGTWQKMCSAVLAMLTIILAICTCLMPKVQVKAASIYNLAEELGTDESVTCYPTGNNEYYYKVTLTEKGLLTLNVESKRSTIYICLYNEDGKHITKSANISSKKGYINDYNSFVWDAGDGCYPCIWNNDIERMEGYISWELEKGTYYFKIWSKHSASGDTDTTLTTSFKSTASKAATSVVIQLELSVDSSITLNAILNPEDSTSKVTWKSSRKSVCKVSSKGKVTAVGEGTCTIYAIANGHKARFRIKVVE